MICRKHSGIGYVLDKRTNVKLTKTMNYIGICLISIIVLLVVFISYAKIVEVK